jgi:hypothetical protein
LYYQDVGTYDTDKTYIPMEYLSGGIYRWQVWAVDNAGNESAASAWLYFYCPDVVPPPIPTPLRPGNTNPQSPELASCPVTLTWGPVFDPSGVVYEVALDRLAGFGEFWQSVGSWDSLDASALKVPCSDGEWYRWRVRAEDGAGNQSDWSPWMYYRIPPRLPTPTGLKPGSTDPENPEGVLRYEPLFVTLSWDPVISPSGRVYEVDLHVKDDDGNWQTVDVQSPVSASDLELSGSQCQYEKDYRWRVRSGDGAGNWGDWAEPRYYWIIPAEY